MMTLYCYPDTEQRWHLAVRTPDRLLWHWKENTWESRQAIEQEALERAARLEQAHRVPVAIVFEVPAIDPEAVGVVEFHPDRAPNRQERRRNGGRRR